MATRTIAGKTVQVNDEGFMTNPAEWNEGNRRRDRQGRGHRRADRRALEGHRLLPRRVQEPGRQVAHAAPDHHRHRRPDQGAVRPVPEGPGQEGRPHRRPGQTGRLCVMDATLDRTRESRLTSSPAGDTEMADETRKVAFICSKGTLDMAYPALVMGWAALGNGIDVTIFFTFWGMDMITKARIDHLELAPVANTSMKMSMMGVTDRQSGHPEHHGRLPGMTAFATKLMKKKIAEVGAPPVREYLQMLVDGGAKLYACKMSRGHDGPEEGRLRRRRHRHRDRQRLHGHDRRRADHLHLNQNVAAVAFHSGNDRARLYAAPLPPAALAGALSRSKTEAILARPTELSRSQSRHVRQHRSRPPRPDPGPRGSLQARSQPGQDQPGRRRLSRRNRQHPRLSRGQARAEADILETEISKTYLGMAGLPEFTAESRTSSSARAPRSSLSAAATTVQAPGGTGALRVAGDFIKKAAPDAEGLGQPADLAQPPARSSATPGWRSKPTPTSTPRTTASTSTR